LAGQARRLRELAEKSALAVNARLTLNEMKAVAYSIEDLKRWLIEACPSVVKRWN
jgi:hypothetical protein